MTDPTLKSIPWWMTRRSRTVFLITAVCLVSVFFIWRFLFYPYVSTDDARVAAVLNRVAPLRQSGRILNISVNEGDAVKKGDLLIELEHEVPEAQLLKAKARLQFASLEFDRYARGAAMRIVQQHDIDQMRSDLDAARADLRLAQANYDDTFLRSPCDGIVVRRMGEPGNLLESGQTGLVVAGIGGAWIAANIEETSVGEIKPGQPVSIHVDEGYDLKGVVGEVIHATVSQFALIPADNASGNFTKVVQRVPVKILLRGEIPSQLRVGESVEVKIRVH